MYPVPFTPYFLHNTLYTHLKRVLQFTSKTKISAVDKSTDTNARRFLCPPDNCPHGCVKSVTPSFVSILFASASMVVSLSKLRLSLSTASNTVSSAANSGFCGKNPLPQRFSATEDYIYPLLHFIYSTSFISFQNFSRLLSKTK